MQRDAACVDSITNRDYWILRVFPQLHLILGGLRPRQLDERPQTATWDPLQVTRQDLTPRHTCSCSFFNGTCHERAGYSF
jgi:hypothetical protein